MSRVHAKPVPGPMAWPFVGNALQLDKSKFHLEMTRLADEYGEMFQLNMLGLKYLIINTPDLFDTVLRKYTCRPHTIAATVTFNGNGVDFTNKEFLVEEMKRVCHDIAEDQMMQELFVEEVNTLIDVLKASGDTDVEVNSTLRATSEAYILRALLGCKPSENDILALRGIHGFGDIFGGTAGVVLTSMPWLRFIPGPLKWKFDAHKTAIENMVKCFIETIHSGSGNGHGAIENLMARKRDQDDDSSKKEDETLSDENIYAFAFDIIIGSVIPITKYMIGTILCILKDQTVQDKIHAELDSVCGNQRPDEKTRDQLPYLNAVLLEARRYLSILTFTLPHTTLGDTDINGFFVEKGTQIFGNMFYINHAEKTWNQPWEFRPERFLDTSGNLVRRDDPKRASLKTFGTGQRSCKGYTIAEVAMFRYTAAILYTFNIVPPADGHLPDSDPRTFAFAPALTPPDVRCRFELRHKN